MRRCRCCCCRNYSVQCVEGLSCCGVGGGVVGVQSWLISDLPETEDYLAVLVLLHRREAVAVRLADVVRILADVAVALDGFCWVGRRRNLLKSLPINLLVCYRYNSIDLFISRA